ncbi:TrmH family RNA methyltransferase [Candidatus Uhrbacteria bacterium]|nr:TrmH family RNA methyltransferase [Candidatus Uhrbacteria bacterium]
MASMRFSILAHNIRSLYNVGAFFRNADGFGASHVYLTGYTATPPRPEITKVALGAEQTIPWSKHEDVYALLQRHPSLYQWHAPHMEHCVFLFGNEPNGLDDEILALVHQGLYIPMRGTKSSLNVAVAAGVILCEAARQTGAD